MSQPSCEIVVRMLSPFATASAPDTAQQQVLRSLGFELERDEFKRSVVSEADMIALINSLNSAGALFSSGQGWSPEALAAHYVELGQVSPPYRVISWAGPNSYKVELRDR